MNLNESMILKLTNFLKGQATSVLDANERMYTLEEKVAQMKTIEEFLEYIRNYEQNQQILKQNIMER